MTADGTLYVTSHEAGEIFKVSPTGASSVFTAIEGKVTGIALTLDGGLIVTGWDGQGQCILLGVAPDGVAKTVATLPEAQFLNGITPLNSLH